MYQIEICGNIASGKTTLCSTVTQMGVKCINENFQSNPFWEKFYQDPIAFSFETELTFLLQHYHDIKIAPDSEAVSYDFSLVQDMAYADINLSGEKLRIFEEVHNELRREVGYPNHLVHLVCPEEVLLQRIINRSRDAEVTITIDYLAALGKALHNRVKEAASHISVITIDSNRTDFRTSIEDVPNLPIAFS